MATFYSITQQAIRDLSGAMRDLTEPSLSRQREQDKNGEGPGVWLRKAAK
jgi:hypothetical protein